MTIEEQTQGLTSIELPLMVKRKTKKKMIGRVGD
jgi:hypothetical protein